MADITTGKESLDARARRASVWATVGIGLAQILRFGSNLILTRLLFAEAFGLMALVGVVIRALDLFSDFGIRPNIVQSERGEDPGFLDTAWTVQVIRGAVLWLVACAAAVPFARFYEEELLAWILPIVALSALLGGFNSTKLYIMDRRLAQGRLMLIDLLSQAIGIAVMIAWAVAQRSVWALVAGSITVAAVRLAASHVMLPGRRNQFCWDREAIRSLVQFGRWIFLSTILTFFAGQSDRLIFGRMIPLDLLGIYSIGLMIATLPTDLLMQLTSRVVFPLYSRVRSTGGDLDRPFRAARWPILVAGGWALCGLMAGGTAAIELLYDPRYADAGWVVQLLAFGGWLHLLESTYGAALLAQGRSNWVAAGSAAKLVGMALLMPLGFHWLAFPGAVAGYAASELFRYGVSVLAGLRTGLRGWTQDLGLSSLLLGVAALVWSGDLQLREMGVHVVVEAGAIAATVTLCWLPVAAPLLVRQLISRKPTT